VLTKKTRYDIIASTTKQNTLTSKRINKCFNAVSTVREHYTRWGRTQSQR